MARCLHRILPIVAICLLAVLMPAARGTALGTISNTLAAGNEAADPAAVSSVTAAADAQEEQVRFDAWLDQLFREEVVQDTIGLHAVLSRPAELGIDDYPLVLSAPLPAADGQLEIERMRAKLDELRGFEVSLLTGDQSLTYAFVEETLGWLIGLQEMDLLTQYARPGDGLHVQDVIMLSEYEFTNERDIEDYFVLLGQLRPCFEAVVVHAREQVEVGVFMSDEATDRAVEQCLLLAEPSDSHPLIDTFERRIDEADFLDEAARVAYKERNAQLFEEAVGPAYSYLANELQALKGKGGLEAGLCTVEGGREYYGLLVRWGTGSSRSIDEMFALSEEYLLTAMAEFDELVECNPDAVYRAFELGTVELADAPKVVADLQERVREDFPYLSDRAFSVCSVAPSLEAYTNPASYILAPWDNSAHNTVFLNEAFFIGDYQGFPTLAHEAFPGHLYQTNYFYENGAYPLIRRLLACEGYVEGWGLYAEMFSYRYMDDDADVWRARELDRTSGYSIASLIDMGVNYYGWSREEVGAYFEDLGIWLDSETIDFYYDEYAIGSPATCLVYWIGYWEIRTLRDEAQAALGDDFDLREFHRFLLETGPAPFDLIHECMALWVAGQLAATDIGSLAA